MKEENKLNPIKEMFWDFWHYKLVHEPVLKEDCITADLFKDRINEPFELYEKYIRSIEVEKRVAFIASLANEEKKELFEKLAQNIGIEHKIFVGEYNEAMKEEIENFLDEKGFSHLRREATIDKPLNPKISSLVYHCDVYDVEHMLGFYLKREGLLRGCMNREFSMSSFGEEICGRREDFESISKFLDKEYIQVLYGDEGWAKINSYYQKNFLDNFEHGESIAVHNTGSMRGDIPMDDEEGEDE